MHMAHYAAYYAFHKTNTAEANYTDFVDGTDLRLKCGKCSAQMLKIGDPDYMLSNITYVCNKIILIILNFTVPMKYEVHNTNNILL